MPPAQLLTARGLAALKPGEWASDARPRGAGQLQARKLAGGALAWYYRYTDSRGKQDRLPLGTALTLAQAREQAAALSLRYQAGERDLRRALEAERAIQPKETSPTLGDLMTVYVAFLRAAGKVSADGIEGEIGLHVKAPFPALWDAPAQSLGLDDLLPIPARLVQDGKRRQAGKIRSYLHAAYAAAIRARQDPSMPEGLRKLGIASNPVRDLATIEGGNNPRDRVLSLGELRAYWRRIANREDAEAAALRFHLLTGGQRIAQLARLQVPDLDDDSATVRLLDIKGRRKKARVHMVPLLQVARDAIDTMRGDGLGPFLFTLSQGVEGASYDALYDALQLVVDAMEAAGELEGRRFTPGDVRRTVETRLAAEGHSDEARGQLQSHGLGGVQNRHYNRHHYDAEKRAALEALYALLVPAPATVTRLPVPRIGATLH